MPLVARLIPPPGEVPAERAGWLLYLHGSGGNVGNLGYNEAWAKFRRMGLGVLAVDYRGYGESGGQPSEAGLYRDADAGYAYLRDQLRVPPTRLLIYGYSLGSAVAIDLAARVPAAGLMVEGALLSVPARGGELYPFLPAHWLARNRFASIDRIGRVSMPKLFIHARADAEIPISHGRGLYERARPPKSFQEVAGGHTDAHEVDPEFFRAVFRFVASLGIPTNAPGTARPPALDGQPGGAYGGPPTTTRRTPMTQRGFALFAVMSFLMVSAGGTPPPPTALSSTAVSWEEIQAKPGDFATSRSSAIPPPRSTSSRCTSARCPPARPPIRPTNIRTKR